MKNMKKYENIIEILSKKNKKWRKHEKRGPRRLQKLIF